MEQIKLSIDAIKEYENNPRDNDKAVDAVIASIQQCGYIAPIIVDENHEILAGHTRFRALKRLGHEEISVLVAKDLTEDKKRKYRILDNRVGEFSYWDYQKLYQELEGLDFEGFNFGFEKLTEAMDQDIDTNAEYTMEDFGDERFKHECPECGFKFN